MTEAKDFYMEVGNEEKAKIFSDSIGVELERGKAGLEILCLMIPFNYFKPMEQ